MKLEVLLSVINLNKNELQRMNITSDTLVINQCDKNDFYEFKNYRIYSYNEKGLSNSRNRGLEHVKGDIIVLCDDDVIYDKDYEKIILDAFKNNKDADVITFNIKSLNRKMKKNKRNRRVHIYNLLRYTSSRIAFKREKIEKANIKFNTTFGAGAKYSHGEDTLFLVDALRNKLKIYASVENIATVNHTNSTWFNGYNEKFFYDKGAVFAAISKRFRHILIIQYLLRHGEVLKEMKFIKALKVMIKGANDYKKEN